MLFLRWFCGAFGVVFLWWCFGGVSVMVCDVVFLLGFLFFWLWCGGAFWVCFCGGVLCCFCGGFCDVWQIKDEGRPF